MSPSRCRQNFSAAAEAAINDQINMELTACYAYTSMGSYFSHDTVALPGLAQYFKHEADEERHHADKLMQYLTARGGHLVLQAIDAPRMDWTSAKCALEAALELEKKVNASLLKLHGIAGEHNDAHLTDFIEEEFLEDQIKTIKLLADMLTKLERCGEHGLGLYIFDRDLKA